MKLILKIVDRLYQEKADDEHDKCAEAEEKEKAKDANARFKQIQNLKIKDKKMEQH